MCFASRVALLLPNIHSNELQMNEFCQLRLSDVVRNSMSRNTTTLNADSFVAEHETHSNPKRYDTIGNRLPVDVAPKGFLPAIVSSLL